MKFIYFDDWFAFLYVNREKIALRDFRKISTTDNLVDIKNLIPRNSQAHQDLKKAFDRKYNPDAPRGVYYPYLLKACSGFASVWENQRMKPLSK